MKKKINKKLKKELKKKKINLTIYYFISFLKNKKEKIITFLIFLLMKSIKKGNICLPIKTIINEKNIIKNIKKKKLISILLNSQTCSTGDKITPIIFSKGNIYLYNMWKIEKKISIFFSKIKKTLKLDYKKQEILLNYLKKKKFNKYQKNIIIKGILYNKLIITGGPGTGKTTIVAKIILILIKIINKKLKITLSAPTSKATVLLKQKFDKIIQNVNSKESKKKNIEYISKTLHSLLNFKKTTQEPTIKKKIKTDIIIIDETSMIDLYMMNFLINALSKKTKIFFIGDPNQLPSIYSGSIFKDLCYYKENIFKKISNLLINKNYIKKKTPPKIKTIICKLKKNYRFKKKTTIYKISKLILKKKTNFKKIKKILKIKKKNIIFNKIKKKIHYKEMIKQLSNRYIPFIKNDKNIIKKINENRILCFTNKGNFGTKKINKFIDNYIINKTKIYFKKINNCIIYHGKPIMITKNDNILKLYNGEIGIINIKKKKITVNFKKKKISIYSIRNFEETWSTTIHKSQGLEFKKIYIILPNKISKILTKNLIYTAITRAKKKILIYGNKKIFIKCCKKKIVRYSGIINNLK